MPTPSKNEKKEDYIKRCIPIIINEGTAKNSNQAAAICYSMWKEHHKNIKANSTEEWINSIFQNLNE